MLCEKVAINWLNDDSLQLQRGSVLKELVDEGRRWHSAWTWQDKNESECYLNFSHEDKEVILTIRKERSWRKWNWMTARINWWRKRIKIRVAILRPKRRRFANGCGWKCKNGSGTKIVNNWSMECAASAVLKECKPVKIVKFNWEFAMKERIANLRDKSIFFVVKQYSSMFPRIVNLQDQSINEGRGKSQVCRNISVGYESIDRSIDLTENYWERKSSLLGGWRSPERSSEIK